jgi:5-methylcytosine-specific restriction endonuclease McrA
MKKRCGRCKKPVDVGLFKASKTSPDGLQGWCIPCFKEYGQLRYQAQKDVFKQRAKIWQANNQERYQHLNQRWIANNLEHVRWSRRRRDHRRRIREMTASGSYTSAELQRLVDFYQGVCPACTKVVGNLTVDHVIPLSRGGDNTLANLQLLCKSCNSKKHTKITDFRPIELEMACD